MREVVMISGSHMDKVCLWIAGEGEEGTGFEGKFSIGPIFRSSIFTQSGCYVRRFALMTDDGMVRFNVGIPTSTAYFLI